MKKTLMVIMMALLAVSVAFAGANQTGDDSNLNTSPTSVAVNATLTLGHGDFSGYSFGFSSDDPALGLSTDTDVTNVTQVDNVIINYSGSGVAASDTFYFYYKIRTGKNVTLEISADRLKKSGENVYLNYSIEGTNLKSSTVSVSGDGTKVMTATVNNGYDAKKGAMKISLQDLNVNNIGSYTAAITFNVTAAE